MRNADRKLIRKFVRKLTEKFCFMSSIVWKTKFGFLTRCLGSGMFLDMVMVMVMVDRSLSNMGPEPHGGEAQCVREQGYGTCARIHRDASSDTDVVFHTLSLARHSKKDVQKRINAFGCDAFRRYGYFADYFVIFEILFPSMTFLH